MLTLFKKFRTQHHYLLFVYEPFEINSMLFLNTKTI